MLARFRELQRHQRASHQTPNTPDERQIDSYENIGEQRYVRVERILDLRNVEQILYKARAVAKKLVGSFKLWYATCTFSGFGDRLFASGVRMLDVSKLVGSTEKAELFQAEGYDNTGVWNSRHGMLIALEGLLESYAATPRTIVWLHGILIKNFDRKRGERR
jgi:hypothetical protein